jgi:hypothetical protein
MFLPHTTPHLVAEKEVDKKRRKIAILADPGSETLLKFSQK